MCKRVLVVIFLLFLVSLHFNEVKAATKLNYLITNKNLSLEELYGYKKNNITPPTTSASSIKNTSSNLAISKSSSVKNSFSLNNKHTLHKKNIKKTILPTNKYKTKRHKKNSSSPIKKVALAQQQHKRAKRTKKTTKAIVKIKLGVPQVKKSQKKAVTLNTLNAKNKDIYNSKIIPYSKATTNLSTVSVNNRHINSTTSSIKKNSVTNNNLTSVQFTSHKEADGSRKTAKDTTISDSSLTEKRSSKRPTNDNISNIAKNNTDNINIPNINNINSNKTGNKFGIGIITPGYIHYSAEDTNDEPSFVRNPDNVTDIKIITKQNNNLDKDYQESFLTQLPIHQVKTALIKKPRKKPDLNYYLILKSINNSNDFYIEALSINSLSRIIKEEIIRNNFSPYISKVGNIITEFPNFTFYSDIMAQMNSAILLNKALEAITNPKQSVSYRYAYVDNFLTSRYFENLNIVPTNNVNSNSGYNGNFYKISNNKTHVTNIIFIEQDEHTLNLPLPKEFLLRYIHKSLVPYYTVNKEIIYVPHFLLVKPLNINYVLAPKDIFEMSTMCKIYFANSRIKNLLYQKYTLQNKNASIPQDDTNTNTPQLEEISLELNNICSNSGAEELTPSILNNSLKLNKEEMKEYLDFIILRNNKITEVLQHERNFLAQYYPELYKKYKTNYNYSIEKIAAANYSIEKAVAINLKRT